ncbi:hypothetical protein EVG20_g8868 [Dentipellis fragilis]|uniref:Uncharacterized protein n=1 Tax=Dentipellis fragilis TaxID=205917 RepID=A0A4Y9Y3D1_9AGAM|nr:hypothetical protein EVG20_g8868 [Dentipellis fragilis]
MLFSTSRAFITGSPDCLVERVAMPSSAVLLLVSYHLPSSLRMRNLRSRRQGPEHVTSSIDPANFLDMAVPPLVKPALINVTS